MDLIMNSSTCRLNNEIVHLWKQFQFVHFVDFVINLSTCGLDNELIHLWTQIISIRQLCRLCYKSSFVETNKYTGHV